MVERESAAFSGLKLTCSFNDLKGLGGLRKYLRGCKRESELGWSSWVWQICFGTLLIRKTMVFDRNGEAADSRNLIVK
jgi:hypothetical protein